MRYGFWLTSVNILLDYDYEFFFFPDARSHKASLTLTISQQFLNYPKDEGRKTEAKKLSYTAVTLTLEDLKYL